MNRNKMIIAGIGLLVGSMTCVGVIANTANQPFHAETVDDESCQHDYFLTKFDWKEDAENIVEKIFTCILCDNTRTEYIDFNDAFNQGGAGGEQHAHEFVKEGEVDPTCTNSGYTLLKCECGSTYKDNLVDPLGHKYVDYICERCGQEDPNKPQHVHNYAETVTQPTCTEGGYTTYECECGDTYTDKHTSALGHDFNRGTCERCGEKDPNYKEDVYTVDSDLLKEAM